MSHRSPFSAFFEGVLRLRAAGLATIPIKTDGSKRPDLPSWKRYQTTLPTEAELAKWFGQAGRSGLAIIGGKVSGNLEVLDFDAPELIEEWRALVNEAAPDLLATLPQVQTPTGGLHVYYRCAVVQGNLKLATTEKEVPAETQGAVKRNGKFFQIETLIETRGTGGYVLAPGCPAACHPSGKPYKLIHGDLKAIAVITPEQRDVLLTCARSFNEYFKTAQHIAPEAKPKADALKPGSDYNQRGDIRGLLTQHGWRHLRDDGKGELWARPGAAHISARLFADGTLYPFSTNAHPFSHEKSYSAFAVFAHLEHGGDFQAATKALAAQGFGEPAKAKAAQHAPAAKQENEAETTQQQNDEDEIAYKANGRGLVWLKPIQDRQSKEWRTVPVLLTNFWATITGDVIKDDGTEQSHNFEISARLAEAQSDKHGIVSASDFGSLRWVSDVLGARAVIYPGKTEHAKCAIQLLSNDIKPRRVIAHTGWRNDGEGWRYYHASGAIGAEGLIEAEVSLPPALAPCSLPVPPVADERKAVIHALIERLDIAPDAITIPLQGASLAAILGGADFTAALFGYTGSGKTQLSALIQSDFGSGFDAQHLPASWSSTGNSLEAIAHAAKDCVLTVDDFCPVGASADVSRLHAAADRLLRAQGNGSGRARCRVDGSVRPAKPPRGLLLSTGEDVPRGQSLRARMLILELAKDALKWEALTECQRRARKGIYAQATAAFLQWLASDSRIEALQAEAPEKVAEMREYWLDQKIDSHKRAASTLAYQSRAWGIWLQFAVDVGAITEEQQKTLWARITKALKLAGAAQAAFQTSENPAIRFVELLQAAFASGKAHVAATDNGKPSYDAESWGWRGGDAQGERIGWLDEKNLYIQPDAALSVVQRMAGNEALNVSAQTLWKRVNEASLLASTDTARNTLKIRRMIGKQSQTVLHFSAEKFAGQGLCG